MEVGGRGGVIFLEHDPKCFIEVVKGSFSYYRCANICIKTGLGIRPFLLVFFMARLEI